MEKKLLLMLLCLFSFGAFLFAGDGSETNPFSVSEAIKVKNTAQVYWVKGYIVGEMRDYSNNKYFYEVAPPFSGTSAYLIADKADELDITKCMPIESKNYSDLDENPEYWRKPVMISGNVKDYFSLPGIKNLNSFEILAAEPLNDESVYWNFYEDFDSKTYIPASTTHTFAGGTYTGYTGEWTFKGATWGDSGKDQKWDRAAARIRLTEGPTGDVGYIETKDIKENGVGVVRFWAGNYEEDTSGGALALYVSGDGKTWEKVAHSQNVSRTWKEYQFEVNRQGSLYLRIAKDESGSKGINVDNVRISDFHETTGLKQATDFPFNYYLNEGSLNVDFGSKTALVSIYHINGQCLVLDKSFSGKVSIPLDKGIYVLKIDDRAVKVILP